MMIENTFMIVFFHHVWLLILNCNFDFAFLFFFTFSFVWVWVVPSVEDANPLSPYYQSIYPTMLRSPVFWLNVLMGVGL